MNGKVSIVYTIVKDTSNLDLFSYIPIESIVKENQKKYYDALEEAGTIGESTPFVEFMLGSILQTLKQFLKQNAKSDQKILALIKKNSKVTIREIYNTMGLSESGVKKVIKKLKDAGTLVHVSALKGAHWEVH